MGDYLKIAYLLSDLNKQIDDNYQELSDKLENLRLSHNRKVRALVKIRDLTDSDEIIKICDSALFCDGRERSKK